MNKINVKHSNENQNQYKNAIENLFIYDFNVFIFHHSTALRYLGVGINTIFRLVFSQK